MGIPSANPRPPAVRWTARSGLAGCPVRRGVPLPHLLRPGRFGKYNLRYFTFLLIWYLAFVPGTFFFVRFLLTMHEIRLASGRTIMVRPRLKLTLTLIAALVGYIALDTLAQRQLASRPVTHASNVFHPYLQNALTQRRGVAHQPLGVPRRGDREAKPAGTFRIFFFGGSTVICEEVPFEDSHCRVLEKRLRAAYPGRKIEVQNLGAEWHTSAHSVMKLLFQAQEFSPDLVIVCHAINDLTRSFEADAFTEGPYQNDYGHYYGPIIGMVRRATRPRSWSARPGASGAPISAISRCSCAALRARG